MEQSPLKPDKDQIHETRDLDGLTGGEQQTGEESVLSQYKRIAEEIQKLQAECTENIRRLREECEKSARRLREECEKSARRLREKQHRAALALVPWPQSGENGEEIRAVLNEQGIESSNPGVIVLRSVNAAASDLKHTGEGIHCKVILSEATDEDLHVLASCDGAVKITSLDLWKTEVTDKGMVEIAKLRGLLSLDLEGTEVTDAGMVEIAKLRGLTSLSLRGTKVTDVGVLTAAPKLTRLTSLDLRGTNVTNAVVTWKLRSALPQCQILQ